MGIEAVSLAHNVSILRKMQNGLESHIWGLKSLEVSSSSYVICWYLQELHLLITCKVKGDDWGVDNIMKELEEEIRELGSAQTSNDSGIKQGHKPSSAGSKGVSCCQCLRPGHTPELCLSVSHLDARKILRCSNCLRRGHPSRDCYMNIKCTRCSGKNHALHLPEVKVLLMHRALHKSIRDRILPALTSILTQCHLVLQ